MNETPEVPKPGTPIDQKLLSVIVVTAVITAGVVYFWQRTVTDKAVSRAESANERIKELEPKLEKVEKELTEIKVLVEELLKRVGLEGLEADDLKNSAVKERDADRISSIRQYQTAAELYFNECNSYPPGQGVILGGEGLWACGGWGEGGMIQFLESPSPAPTPADGDCTPAQNSYVYTQLASGADYSLTFCLGGTSGGLTAGVHTASSAGIR